MSQQPVYITAPHLAQRLGLKSSALARWRREGYGPKGWFFVSATTCVYPLAEVEAFEAERRSLPAPVRDMARARAARWRKAEERKTQEAAP